MTKLTKNELVAINSRLSAEVAALRAQVSELTVRCEAIKSNGRRQSASKGAAPGTQRRPLASFFFLKDAGDYITSLKQRGCSLPLTTKRDDRGHFVVWASTPAKPVEQPWRTDDCAWNNRPCVEHASFDAALAYAKRNVYQGDVRVDHANKIITFRGQVLL